MIGDRLGRSFGCYAFVSHKAFGLYRQDSRIRFSTLAADMTTKTYNRTLGQLRLIALFVLVAALLYLSEPTRRSVLSGLFFVVIGESIRFWAAGHLFKTKELITSGPYRYTRNPLYLGRFLIFTGLCIMARLPYGGSWVILVLGYAAFFGYYLPRKERIEPARLREEHGEPFDRYLAAVPALFPKLPGYADASPGRWQFERMVRNKEYWMVIGLAAITIFLWFRAS